MSREPKIMDYNSIQDLEQTIDEIYEIVTKLDNETENLAIQTDVFMNTNFISEEFISSANYTETNLPHEAIPKMAHENAKKELKRYQQASNWEKLEESAEIAEGILERYEEVYQKLWNTFGYEGQDLRQEIQGVPPVQHFISRWRDQPYVLFRSQESFDEAPERLPGKANPGLTMARYFEIEENTSKQHYDMMRGIKLSTELKQREHNPRFQKYEDAMRKLLFKKPEYARWVDQQQLKE